MPDHDRSRRNRKAIRLRVGGLTLAVTSTRATPALDPPPAFHPFLAFRGGDIRLSFTEDAVPVPRREDLLFTSGGVWRVHRWEEGFLYTFKTSAAVPPVYKAVAIDRNLTRGRLHFPPPRRGVRPRYALDFPLDELLFQHRLAREGGLELHACGVVDGGGALLFCGRSGAGKSTTARLWRRHRPRATLLSDDRIILRARGDAFRAHGTPWHGDGGFASPGAAPLRGLFFLRHAPRNRAVRVSPSEAAARLFTRSFPPPWDADAIGRVLETCVRVASSVPAYELRFRPDAAAIETALDALAR